LSRSINGVAASQTYEPLGRIDTVTNALGNFTYSYVGATSRIQNVNYPNGQTTNFLYFPNTGDRRLQEINNQKTGAVTISKFDYVYDPVGNITTWTQQTDSGTSAVIHAYDFTYDPTDQLTTARLRTTDAVPTTLKRYGYVYDPAGNRTTEQIDDAPLQASYNNMNRMLTQQAGNTFYFSGTLSKPATVTIQGKSATVSATNTFTGTAAANSGTVSITARDYSGNQRTNTYQLSPTGTTKSFTYDANGNLTGDGTRTFEWDAENRLTAINNGTQRSEFSYDGLSRRIRIVEKTSGATTSDLRYLWCAEDLCEQRDSTGATTTARYFPQGEQQGTDAFFYTRDHLGSIRELVDSTGNIRARYDYDPYGRVTKLSGDKDASFTFAGDYMHWPSSLLLTHFRAYDSNTGRFISQDPIFLFGGSNYYSYVLNNPENYVDPSGLVALADDLVLAGGGAIIGLGVQAASDLVSWHRSDWQHYVGAAAGGAIGGLSVEYTGGALTGALTGTTTNAVTQSLEMLSGNQAACFNYLSNLADTGIGAIGGFIPDIEIIPGLSAGRNSYNAIAKTIRTQLRNGTRQTVGTRAAAKALIGRNIAGAAGLVIGVAASALGGGDKVADVLRSVVGW
jgi:RHS repeat-associated protein